MFNESNVDNRLRHLVRGRVIVGTTSKVVELLQTDLERSCPLYSADVIPAGCMLVFSGEFNGFLTFDEGSEVRILADLGEYERTSFDPTAFSFVRTSDPYVPLIVNAYGGRYDNEGGTLSEAYVSIQLTPTRVIEFSVTVDAGTNAVMPADFYFPKGSAWPGRKNLPKGFRIWDLEDPNIDILIP